MAGTLVSQTRLRCDRAVTSLADYREAGGCIGLEIARGLEPSEVIALVTEAGLRGRGGAGFPTGAKWRSVRDAADNTTQVVCNAAEGEPATFKDRWLLRRNPYQVFEGLLIAAHAAGAWTAFLALKRSFAPERAAVERARSELADAGLLGDVHVEIVAGPDDYLFGEETAMLEVIEGRPSLPRVLPPYQVGLFAQRGSRNATVVNNAETLAHVPTIFGEGISEFRSLGTDDSPGTMLFTVCGDVRRARVVELELGTPLRELISTYGGGTPEGRAPKAVFPGASVAVLTAEQLDTPLSYEALREVGSGLGSGGFAVYDDSACIVQATAAFTRFLHAGSCEQCPACTRGCAQISAALERIEAGKGDEDDLDIVRSKARSVTGGARCGLPLGAQHLVQSVLANFADELEAHLGQRCPHPRRLPFPHLADFDEEAGLFIFAGQSGRVLDDQAGSSR